MTAPDVHIRRCTVRVVRRSGWSWGPDPRGLAESVLARVVAEVAELVAAAVAERHPADADVDIARVRVTLAAPSRAGGRDPRPQTLRAATADAVAAALGPAPGPRDRPAPAPPPALPVAAPAPGVLAVLVEWHHRGRLPALLHRLGPAVLEDWHRAVAAALTGPQTGAGEPGVAHMRDVVHRAAAGVDGLGRSRQLRRRLAACAAVAAELGLAPGHSALRAALDAAAPLPPPAPADDPEKAVRDPSASPKPGPGPAAAARTGYGPGTFPQARRPVAAPPAANARSAPTDVAIASALPFLLLRTLSTIGWLRCAAATFAAAGRPSLLPALAYELALAVLDASRPGSSGSVGPVVAAPPSATPPSSSDPPTRSAVRVASPGRVARGAAAFAGGADPPSGHARRELAGLADRIAAPLDAVVACALAEGHTPGRPLLVCNAPTGGAVLFDTEGLFPIAWADDGAELRARASELLPDTPVVTGPGDAGPAGARVPTDKPPAGTPGGTEAGDAHAVLAALVPAAPGSAALGPALHRCLALAAGTALADLAWMLWRDRGPTDPMQALDRLGDLDGAVRLEPDRVRVRLPLGPRRDDLARHGYLRPVTDVPWFGGRPLEFDGS